MGHISIMEFIRYRPPASGGSIMAAPVCPLPGTPFEGLEKAEEGRSLLDAGRGLSQGLFLTKTFSQLDEEDFP